MMNVSLLDDNGVGVGASAGAIVNCTVVGTDAVTVPITIQDSLDGNYAVFFTLTKSGIYQVYYSQHSLNSPFNVQDKKKQWKIQDWLWEKERA